MSLLATNLSGYLVTVNIGPAGNATNMSEGYMKVRQGPPGKDELQVSGSQSDVSESVSNSRQTSKERGYGNKDSDGSGAFPESKNNRSQQKKKKFSRRMTKNQRKNKNTNKNDGRIEAEKPSTIGRGGNSSPKVRKNQNNQKKRSGGKGIVRSRKDQILIGKSLSNFVPKHVNFGPKVKVESKLGGSPPDDSSSSSSSDSSDDDYSDSSSDDWSFDDIKEVKNKKEQERPLPDKKFFAGHDTLVKFSVTRREFFLKWFGYNSRIVVRLPQNVYSFIMSYSPHHVTTLTIPAFEQSMRPFHDWIVQLSMWADTNPTDNSSVVTYVRTLGISSHVRLEMFKKICVEAFHEATSKRLELYKEQAIIHPDMIIRQNTNKELYKLTEAVSFWSKLWLHKGKIVLGLLSAWWSIRKIQMAQPQIQLRISKLILSAWLVYGAKVLATRYFSKVDRPDDDLTTAYQHTVTGTPTDIPYGMQHLEEGTTLPMMSHPYASTEKVEEVKLTMQTMKREDRHIYRAFKFDAPLANQTDQHMLKGGVYPVMWAPLMFKPANTNENLWWSIACRVGHTNMNTRFDEQYEHVLEALIEDFTDEYAQILLEEIPTEAEWLKTLRPDQVRMIKAAENELEQGMPCVNTVHIKSDEVIPLVKDGDGWKYIPRIISNCAKFGMKISGHMTTLYQTEIKNNLFNGKRLLKTAYPHTVLYAAGATVEQLGQYMHEKYTLEARGVHLVVMGDDVHAIWKKNYRTIVFESDFSKYDRTQNQKLLDIWHALLYKSGFLDSAGYYDSSYKWPMTGRIRNNRKFTWTKSDKIEMRYSGEPTTSVANSVVTAISTLIACRYSGVTEEDNMVEIENKLTHSFSLLGLKAKIKASPYLSGTFLKHNLMLTVLDNTDTVYRYVMLPSRLLKLFKSLTNPLDIMKEFSKDNQERYKMFIISQWRGIGAPTNTWLYQGLNKWVNSLDKFKDRSFLEKPLEEKEWKPVTPQYVGYVPDEMWDMYLLKRYGITHEDQQQILTMFWSVKRFPALFNVPAMTKLLADYC